MFRVGGGVGRIPPYSGMIVATDRFAWDAAPLECHIKARFERFDKIMFVVLAPSGQARKSL